MNKHPTRPDMGAGEELEANPYPGRLPALTLIPYRSESYRANPVNNALGTPALPQVIVPGIADLGWRPMTAAIMITSGLGIDGVTVEAIVANGGTMLAPKLPSFGAVIQVRGIVGAGGWYLRRFSLTNFRMIQLDLSRFRDVQIEVLKSTVNGASIVVTVSNQPCETSINEPLWYGEEYTPGTYEVPPGATDVVAEQADGGFTWKTATFGPASAVAIADPLVAGTERTVKGTNFQVTANPFRAGWRIAT